MLIPQLRKALQNKMVVVVDKDNNKTKVGTNHLMVVAQVDLHNKIVAVLQQTAVVTLIQPAVVVAQLRQAVVAVQLHQTVAVVQLQPTVGEHQVVVHSHHLLEGGLLVDNHLLLDQDVC